MKCIFSFLSDFSDSEYEKAYEKLDEIKRERVDRYKRKEDKKRSLFALVLLEKLLKEEYNTTPELYYEENGCPRLRNDGLFVSLSHSHNVAFCGVGNKQIGVDVEKIRPISKSLINRVCTEDEKSFVLKNGCISDEKSIEDRNVTERFFEIWTSKEAYFKMKGSGITDLKSVNTLKLRKEIFKKGDYVFCIVEKD